ncbi:TPA: iron export ABC transporter permease subunit FetB [Staphylococcus aureus]|uniref:Putative permease of an ABC transporter n=6 Tax=Staphylococcus aureus TaxID=1280 RepID=A0A0U1MTC9_STAAU|nr:MULTISPECIES: iron export ABC transporter permease subunit FetB [Staphylococcus]HDH6294235.1 iron export ABC transporter permease subunit FetB [Staphylococcus aureus LTCF-1-17]HDK8976145.1 iron export ABC transporter permease subunit FetB [Staphylococcus aureus USA600-NRS22]HDK9080391.1 iron export ABC transporter permease subunit FetB [Staphylococcus aureus USA600-BAA1754]HDK9082929.1 iron export ABC transporter permease subunit FetB [Staphylococcus aureus USA600-BAA1751]HDQ3544178.1 iron 
MSNTALGLTALLLVIPIIISYKEGLHIIKDLIVATVRAVVQLIILGFLLHYIFKINDKWLLVLCVFVIIVNASWNTISRSSPVMHHVFLISFVAIFVGTALPLAGTIATGAIQFTANEVIPIGGMLANNGLIAINLAYQNLDRAFVQDGTNIESKLSLAATPKLASKGAIRESIRLAIVPTIDSVKTYGLVSIPGMMTGLIIGGVPPLQAIKFQLLVVFIHTTATIMSALIATYLSYGQFFNARHQLVARNTDVKSES